MKEKKFNENVEQLYTTLSNEQKQEYKRKEDKSNKAFYIIGIVGIVIMTAITFLGSILCILEKDYAFTAFVAIFGLILILICIWLIKSSLNGLKTTDEIKIKTCIDKLEKQKQYKAAEKEKQLQRNPYYRLAVNKIANVSILDSYTKYSDKLHAVWNFQEIIQTRVYKFKVDYIDGTSKVVTAAENSEEYKILISKTGGTAVVQQTKNENHNKLREYKKLLDDGIITQEEFDAKKKELL